PRPPNPTMKTKLVITDLTRMQGTRICIAGYTREYECVRPVFWSSGLVERWLRDKGQVVIRPFAIVEFDLQEHTPHPPHTEDWIIDEVYRVNYGILDIERQKLFLTRIADKNVASIFGAPIEIGDGYYIEQGMGTRSLGTVVPRKIKQVSYIKRDSGKWDFRIAFTDGAGQSYNLGVTDLAFRYLLENARVRQGVAPEESAGQLTAFLQKAQVFLRIGLSRNWEKHPDRCFLQITGVHTFPDYLRGRCFADLALTRQELLDVEEPQVTEEQR
ncbi:MAG TPA: hypothetical protein VJ183_10655, partial [Chloroflexia bacterium]|nr:hypothetical protein [Chloroflexia bacterium]